MEACIYQVRQTVWRLGVNMSEALNSNPFSLVKSSDYTDDQINSLWVDLGEKIVTKIIDPNSERSKYILGGKGAGKTHLLRYHAYPVMRKRTPKRKSGLSIVETNKYLAVFLRASTLDSSRFEASKGTTPAWQQLFGVYLEVQLSIAVLEALCNIAETSPDVVMSEANFIAELARQVRDNGLSAVTTLRGVHEWLVNVREDIDDAIAASAFSGELSWIPPIFIGQLALPLKRAIDQLHPAFADTSLIYMLDEIENFTPRQQEVVNTLIRFSEGKASFRISGRLYAVKTYSIIGGAEENREGQEYKIENLDRTLRENQRYAVFAKEFVLRRLGIQIRGGADSIKLPALFEDVKTDDFFREALTQAGVQDTEHGFIENFTQILRTATTKRDLSEQPSVVTETLTADLPRILQKLNILLFCKKYKKEASALSLATKIHEESLQFLRSSARGSYATAFGHYKADLFAQLCREGKRPIPYAGFDLFVDMSCGNPRSLIILLGQVFDIASFKGVGFLDGPPIPIQIQTAAAKEAADFMYENDCNYGVSSDSARISVDRLATVLRTARYALKIPEVAPLAVSFDEDTLTPAARECLTAALSYSMVFRSDGRQDRNSHRLLTKIQLNPMLSPRWGLPTGLRGDISLNSELANAIFDVEAKTKYLLILKSLQTRWNNPFSSTSIESIQERLF